MKPRKIGRMALQILLASVLCAAALQVFAAGRGADEARGIWEPGAKDAPSRKLYLSPAGNGSCVGVQPVSEPACSRKALAAAGAATEETLTPVWIDGTTYSYASRDRTFVVTLSMETDVVPPDETSYNFDWQLQPGAYTHGTTDLGGSGHTRRVYVDGSFRSGDGTVGFYAPEINTYYWIKPPCSRFPSGACFLIRSVEPLQFALKNCGDDSGTYAGQFWKAP